jgi:hypothetical protein
VSLVPGVGGGDPGVPLGHAGVASRFLQLPPGSVEAFGRLFGSDGGGLCVQVGLDQLGLDRRDVVGRPGRAMAGVVDLLLARVHVVPAGRGRGRRGRESAEARDQGEGEGGDADSVHGRSLLMLPGNARAMSE